ncbi:MAG: PDZ domain-containing protein, partial [Phycisphaerae bacterium]|nr:PDZ domain-containing protein [Phycisphaerae bacterium]
MNRPLAMSCTLLLLIVTVAAPSAAEAAAEAKSIDAPVAAAPKAEAAPKPARPAMKKVAYLGIGIKPVAPETAAQVNLPKGAGLAVTVVADGSPASKAGLKTHDILHRVDDQILFNGEQFRSLIRSHKSGDEVQLTVIRQSKPLKIAATLGEQEVPVGPPPAAAKALRPGVFQWRDVQPLAPLPDIDLPEELKQQFKELRQRAEGLPDLKQGQNQRPGHHNLREMQERMRRQMEQMRKQFDLAPGE